MHPLLGSTLLQDYLPRFQTQPYFFTLRQHSESVGLGLVPGFLYFRRHRGGVRVLPLQQDLMATGVGSLRGGCISCSLLSSPPCRPTILL